MPLEGANVPPWQALHAAEAAPAAEPGLQSAQVELEVVEVFTFQTPIPSLIPLRYQQMVEMEEINSYL